MVKDGMKEYSEGKKRTVSSWNEVKGLFALLFGFAIGGMVGSYSTFERCVPKENTNPAYVNPRGLELVVEDLDNIDGNETICGYEGERYLFKTEERHGKKVPVVVPYEIREGYKAIIEEGK